MQHKTLDELTRVAQIARTAHVVPASRAVRRARLHRLATVLDNHDGPIRLLSQIEFVPVQARRQLRADFSPLAFAHADETLRRDGLRSDRLGDAMDFFGLTQWQAHHLFCDCHYGDAITAGIVARRVRRLAERRSVGEWAQAIWTKLAA